VYSDEDKGTVMTGRLPKSSRPWSTYILTFLVGGITIALSQMPRLSGPWPLSLVIALVALALLAWIPMIDWVVRNRQGVAWSVRGLSNVDHAAPRTARVAIWNRGSRAIRNRFGTGDAPFILRIDGHDSETTILDVALVQTTAESIPFQIRIREDRHHAELSTHEIAVRQGAVFNVVHTGARSTDLDVSSNLDNTALAFYRPNNIFTMPTTSQLVKMPSVVLGVFILLALTIFWLHVGHFPLALEVHGVIIYTVFAAIANTILLKIYLLTGRWGSRYFPKYVALPVGLEHFFENGV
jgi:hypothetical protein